MSDVMLFGVLGMPYEMAMADDIARHQYWQRGQQAAAEIAKLRAEVERLTAVLLEAEPTGQQINDACVSFTHDYGLKNPEEREKIAWQAKWWLEAWRKTLARAAIAEQEKSNGL